MKTRDERQKEKIALIVILIAGVCSLTVYFHYFRNIHTVSTHLFYVPIILASLWWQRKGLYVAAFLAIFLIVISLYHMNQTFIMNIEHFLRASMFAVIGVVVSILSERMANKEKELHKEKERLKDALDKVRTLSGMFPICASCKKIRDDKGYWNQIEVYIRDYSEAEFSHGICPECASKLYPEYYKDDQFSSLR